MFWFTFSKQDHNETAKSFVEVGNVDWDLISRIEEVWDQSVAQEPGGDFDTKITIVVPRFLSNKYEGEN